ncbi:hypothetical protein GC207_11455 [bacterium]|nr:hypothetical protein [bacterium]
MTSVWDKLKHRVEVEPFNLWATLLFLGAIIHTFLTHKFRHQAHVLEDRHREKIKRLGRTAEAKDYLEAKDDVSTGARIFHFLGEVEAVFGIWVIPLLILMFLKFGKDAVTVYVNSKVHYTEPLFVVVIMAMASTRPILRLAEKIMKAVAQIGGGGPVAWWFSILTLGPLLGSFITEPGAMTISALLLAKQFYELRPGLRFAYATLGLLFVNVSVGGTLTHFAAPPVLMVAGKWGWNMAFMFEHFGWHAILGITISNVLYYYFFRGEFSKLRREVKTETGPVHWNDRDEPVPTWVTVGHLIFMTWAVINAHHAPFLIGGFLLFMAFFEVTEDYQGTFSLRSPIMVGFFLAGLVIHGGLQQWWIAPVLGSLSQLPMMIGATILTAFNDNAAITYLASLVPGLTETLKHAVVAGAVTGGGLTVIANAPNPAGQSILNKFFPDGVSPMGLFLGALAPTFIVGACLYLLN